MRTKYVVTKALLMLISNQRHYWADAYQ